MGCVFVYVFFFWGGGKIYVFVGSCGGILGRGEREGGKEREIDRKREIERKKESVGSKRKHMALSTNKPDYSSTTVVVSTFSNVIKDITVGLESFWGV